jgi:hypothetical protein
MAAKPQKEKLVKAQVKKLLDDHGWFWWMPPANGFGMTGVADFNAIRKGVFLAIETKWGKNPPTVMQKAYLNSILAENGFGFVVNDTNMPFFMQWMKAFDRAERQVAEQMANPPLPPEDGSPVPEPQPTSDVGSAMLNAIRVLTEPLQS